MNIDVVMITKNSLKPCLYESITSIIRNIPLNKLIIIDSYSNDGTIESIKLFKNINIIIVQNECGRGKAREIGIKNVETEWFAFIDSDVILEENWFSNIEKNISDKIGAIEGNVKSADGKIQKIQQYMRGYTNCTLIRTNLVKDINIPFEINVFEDQYIRKYIEKKKYIWLKVASPCSLHLSRSDRLKDAYEIGRWSSKYHLFPLWRYVTSFFLISIKRLFSREESLSRSFMLLKGYFKGLFEIYK
jgi:glycosyltransferase involved in cell wall biosynthesis